MRDRTTADSAPMDRTAEPLAALRESARRERMLDMDARLRRYRLVAFAILASAMIAFSSEVGWWWIAPLAVGLGGFAVAGQFMRRSAHPGLWMATAWGIVPLLLADAVVVTGGAESPVLMWFALPAVTLGARFDPRGMVLGTAYILALLFVSTFGFDAATASENLQQVVAAAALVLSTIVLTGALVESERAHRRRSNLDPLTGLLNRSALESRLEELEEEAPREERRSYALLLCDLDHFKRVNDRLGHAMGDAVLRDVAYTMRAVLRAGDSIYRVGGEEILVILPGAGREEALEIAERLRLAVRERRPAGAGVTVSIGVAVAGGDEIDADGLIARADAALYAAKAGGRDRVEIDAAGAEPPAPVDAPVQAGGLRVVSG